MLEVESEERSNVVEQPFCQQLEMNVSEWKVTCVLQHTSSLFSSGPTRMLASAWASIVVQLVHKDVLHYHQQLSYIAKPEVGRDM